MLDSASSCQDELPVKPLFDFISRNILGQVIKSLNLITKTENNGASTNSSSEFHSTKLSFQFRDPEPLE